MNCGYPVHRADPEGAWSPDLRHCALRSAMPQESDKHYPFFLDSRLTDEERPSSIGQGENSRKSSPSRWVVGTNPDPSGEAGPIDELWLSSSSCRPPRRCLVT